MCRRMMKSALIVVLLSMWMAGTCHAQSGVCDVTNSEVASGSGYLATTTEVLTSRAYWKYVATHSPLAMFGIDVDDNQLMQQAELTNQSAGNTPWLLSAEAARVLNLDDQKHQEWAAQWWESGKTFLPPGNGRANIQQVYQAIRNRAQ